MNVAVIGTIAKELNLSNSIVKREISDLEKLTLIWHYANSSSTEHVFR